MNNFNNQNSNLKLNQKNQISGIEPNYVYNGVQNLPFDQSSISSSGYATRDGLTKAVEQQQQYVNNYNNFKPLSTFDNIETNSSNLENLKNFSQFNIEKGFVSNQPIQFMPDTINKHETLYDNLNNDLLKESVKEYRLNIDSSDRDIKIYPDPFNYVVFLGPVTNSGINASVSRTNIKDELKNLNKKNRNNKNYSNKLDQIEQYKQDIFDDSKDVSDSKKIFIFDNPNAIKDYTVNLERSFNPYIIRNFINVSYVKLDCAVVPKYNSICINSSWDFCRQKHHKKTFFKDEYDRVKDYIILNNRYIPDDKNEYNPLGDRFIQIYIKELQSIRNFGTNSITDKSFLLIYDKTLGALYLKLVPYSATKTYKDSLLGNLNRLSIQFYNSWGEPLTINTKAIDCEKNQILNTKIIDPEKYDICDSIKSNGNIELFIKNFNEIIKCFIIINYDIDFFIPFYTPTPTPTPTSTSTFDKNTNNIKFHDDCLDNLYINTNDKVFNIKNLYSELSSFVSSNGFNEKIKISKTNKKVKLSVDEYLNNVIWFDFNPDYIEQIYNNIKSLDYNYRSFGFEILDKLKTELVNIPTNKNFQNFLTFLVGVWEDELNTKIDYTK